MTSFATWIPSSQQSICLFCSQVHIQGTTLDINHYQRLASFNQCLHQFLLVTQQIKCTTVITFTAVHIQQYLAFFIISDSCSSSLILHTEVTGTGTTHYQYYYIRFLCSLHCCRNIAHSYVTDSTTLHILHLSLLRYSRLNTF